MQQLGEIGGRRSGEGAVVEEAARRARKYGGSLITATQGADDYYVQADGNSVPVRRLGIPDAAEEGIDRAPRPQWANRDG